MEQISFIDRLCIESPCMEQISFIDVKASFLIALIEKDYRLTKK